MSWQKEQDNQMEQVLSSLPKYKYFDQMQYLH